MNFKVGDAVLWKWAGGVVEGHVEEIYFTTIKREIKGKLITRHGSKDRPAYLVKSKSGNLALKLVTELQQATPEKKGAKRKKRPDVGF